MFCCSCSNLIDSDFVYGKNGSSFKSQAADIMLQLSYTESQTEGENAVYDICRLQTTFRPTL